MTSTPGTETALFGAPRERVGGGWIAAFATAWLGLWMAQLTPVQLLLPTQVDALIATDTWQDSVLAFGIVSGISSVAAIIAYPVTGALSDRTTSRFGRRRPWIAGGALLFAAALVALGVQDTIVGVAICWSLAITGFCALSAALTAMISDQVPVFQRGLVSGVISAPQGVGIIAGILLVTTLFTGAIAGYAALAVLLLVLVAPFLLLVPDAVLPRTERRPFTFVGMLQGFWVSPRRYPDFGWTLLSRVLVNVGNAIITGLLLYFLIYGYGDTPAQAEDDLLLLTLVYTASSITAALVGGRLSDRFARRKPFVLAAAALQAAGALILLVSTDFAVIVLAGAVLGAGYGCFLAVDQALATQVLPDEHSRGKDLGIMNIASVVPQAIGPMIGALIVTAAGGFWALFIASGVIATLGALAVLPIRIAR
ncbi:MFS transporter [Agromyces rhizosphaerae]|uniref:MFS transporter n=1 Tax=Agromyces rhizosphaerae TaxID=88374 RepID=A0A9W6FRL0_9MICO|nr:MFS transporter [Agromyces rhizosphaerae]GLI27782.1 MFS transporter [Agromyces rhizosphaerae]